jgi:biopolymer transport protein TolQ
MQGSALELIFHASWVVKIVLLVLAGFSLFSWTVIFAKYFVLTAALRASPAFRQAVETAQDVKAVLETANQFPQSPSANLYKSAHPALSRLSREDARGVLREAQAQQAEQLRSHMTFLATTGSAAPFIGLLGTVWGIMDAFQGIGETGSASLAVVAPAIAEALVATAAGLAVAIPAVMAYNFYVNMLRQLNVEMDACSEKLLRRFH